MMDASSISRTRSSKSYRLQSLRHSAGPVFVVFFLCLAIGNHMSARYKLSRPIPFHVGIENVISGAHVASQQEEIRKFPGVIVWNPTTQSCKGHLLLQNVGNLRGSRPLLLVREAIVDYRHNSIREFQLNQYPQLDGPFRRIVIYISETPGSNLHLVKPPSDLQRAKREDGLFPTAFISVANEMDRGQLTEWDAEVNYVLKEPTCSPHRSSCNSTIGLNETSSGCPGPDWQIIVSIVGPPEIKTEAELTNALNRLEATADASLHLQIPVKLLSSGRILTFRAQVGLGCISGLTGSTMLPLHRNRRLPHRSASCSNASGSVLVTGTSFFGSKRQELTSLSKQVANFAARALLGNVRFDMVAITTLVAFTTSDIQVLCANDLSDAAACIAQYQAKNSVYLGDIAHRIERELAALGVDEKHWSRVIIYPFCRLGSDALGMEKSSDGIGRACAWSALRGRPLSESHAHTVFSPFFKWFTSLQDMDSFIGNSVSSPNRPPRAILPRLASDIFDERASSPAVLHSDMTTVRMPVLQLEFLEAASTSPRVVSEEVEEGAVPLPHSADPQRAISARLMQLGGQKLMAEVLRKRANNETFPLCSLYAPPRISAVSCHKGIGTTHWDALTLSNKFDIGAKVCATRRTGTQVDANVAGYRILDGQRSQVCATNLEIS